MNFTDSLEPLPKHPNGSDLHFEFRSVPIEQLCFPQLLFEPDSEDCTAKPKLLIPIIVYQSGEGLTVIDGCKRLLEAQRTGMATCDCGVVFPPPDRYQAALLRISLNSGRKLRFREKYLFVRWLKEHCSDSQYSEACAFLSLDSRELFEFEQLVGCDNSVVDAVASGVLEACFAPEVNRLEPSDRYAILKLFSRHAFSRQMQREMLDWLPELAFREKCTTPGLLDSTWLREIEGSVKLNGPQKIEHLRTAVFNRRFPLLARAKEVWKKLAAQCNPDPRHVAFKHFEAFEKNRLEVKISITSADQAVDIFSSLAGISEEEWNRLIYPAQLYGKGNGEKQT